MTRRTSSMLDLMRWSSAVAVVVTHTANLMVARITATPPALRTPLDYLWVFAAGFGHQAVVTFYVLSGFLVGGPLITKCKRDHLIGWKKYLVDRLVRIYLVLIPALGACFVIDRLTYRIRPDWVAPFVLQTSGPIVFAGNLLNLQNFYVACFGSNGPIGTLAMEMWYYISFPLLLSPFCSRYSRPKRTALFSFALVLNAALGIAQPAYLLGFVIWGLGAAARVARRPAFASVATPTILVCVVLLAIRLVMRRQMSENIFDLFVADLVLGASLYVLLTTLNQMPEGGTGWLLWTGHKKLASFSYSLYATHMPLLFLLTAASKAWFGFGIVDVVRTPFEWLLVLGAILATLIFAQGFSLVTEKHTTSVRRLFVDVPSAAVPVSDQVSISSQ